MSERTFIDTNVFVYAEDADEPEKRKIAQRLIQELTAAGRAVISTQVLMEYVAAGQRHLGLTLAECRQAVLLMSHLDVVLIRSEHVLGALDLASTYSLSSWDALILKTASASGCGRLLTEDMQDGQVIDGVRIDNPFS
jgi:predicted nucleic acid-binding protein